MGLSGLGRLRAAPLMQSSGGSFQGLGQIILGLEFPRKPKGSSASCAQENGDEGQQETILPPVEQYACHDRPSQLRLSATSEGVSPPFCVFTHLHALHGARFSHFMNEILQLRGSNTCTVKAVGMLKYHKGQIADSFLGKCCARQRARFSWCVINHLLASHFAPHNYRSYILARTSSTCEKSSRDRARPSRVVCSQIFYLLRVPQIHVASGDASFFGARSARISRSSWDTLQRISLSWKRS